MRFETSNFKLQTSNFEKKSGKKKILKYEKKIRDTDPS